MTHPEFITAPAFVVGGGIAGLSAALGLRDCTVVAGEPVGGGSSRLAQGGIAAAIGDGDSPALHAADTLRVAAALADPAIAALVADAAPDRIEWLRALGHNQQNLITEHNRIFVVRNIKIDYLRPGRLDDLLQIGLEVDKLGRSQIVFRQHARRQEEDGSWTELAMATVQIVCIDFAKFKSAPIPDWLRAKLETLQ